MNKKEHKYIVYLLKIQYFKRSIKTIKHKYQRNYLHILKKIQIVKKKGKKRRKEKEIINNIISKSHLSKVAFPFNYSMELLFLSLKYSQ